MSRRYGVLPSTFIHLDNRDLTFNLLVTSVGTEEEARRERERIRKQLQKR